MLARCPHCQTVFRINVLELRAARGLVRCGVCLSLFNAVDALCEDRGLTKGLDLGGEWPATGTRPAASTAVRSEPGWAIRESEGSLAGAAPLTHDAALGLILEPLEGRDPASPGAGYARWLWGGGIAVLSALLIAQLGWFQGWQLLMRFPELRPRAEQVCAVLGCEVPVYRDPERVRVVSRDVREHPRYQGALLINAVFVNAARFRQPFPGLELRLYDTAGVLLASRRFQPGEYLGRELDADRGMEPGLPIHVVLEVLATDPRPEGFEIDFL